MINRNITSSLLEALQDRPVVLLHGARQVGKTTLVKQVSEDIRSAQYRTLDDVTVLSAAQSDPAGFIDALDGPSVLDEVQRAPDLLLAIKASVDRDRRPGRFLLTGSANVWMLPRLSESLAGRMEVLSLWPLSQDEIGGHTAGFVDTLFEKELPNRPLAEEPDLLSRMLAGGFPEPLMMQSKARSQAWFASYVTTILQRDMRDLSNIESLSALPRLLTLLASRPMGLLNYADLARNSGLPQSTLKRYISLLEATFLVQTVPAWFANVGKRIAKSPKVLLSDTGLTAHLLGADRRRLDQDRRLFGGLLESFVAMELRKQAGWGQRAPQLHHFRTQAGAEVDFVLEDRTGGLVGIEVKASATVRGDDLKGLRVLAEIAPEQFHRGIVLYAGKEVVAFGPRLHAVPLPALWEWRIPRADGGY